MKYQSCGLGVLSIGIALLLRFHGDGLAAEVQADSQAPTGLYMSVIDQPFKFVVRLNTNGNYRVETQSQGHVGEAEASQTGKWKWDNRRQEFLLTPATNGVTFPYEFRRLRVDPQETNTLQWLPLHAYSVGRGAIDYIKFKRKSD